MIDTNLGEKMLEKLRVRIAREKIVWRARQEKAQQWIISNEGWLVFILIGATFGVPVLLLI
jgi:hypothetical protein